MKKKLTLDYLSQLEPEEIGILILDHLNTTPRQVYIGNQPHYERDATWFHHALGISSTEGYTSEQSNLFEKLVMEGWQWLEQLGLIAQDPSQSEAIYKIITRRGKSLSNERALLEFRAARNLPVDVLHPEIIACSKAPFLRSDYDTAVFAAFKRIEIRVREVCGESDMCVGVSLMRSAFNSKSGKLTDKDLPLPERDSMQHLFAGAIGTFKNPGSHREVSYQADEAVELLMFASRLLKIVDKRVSQSQ